LKGSDHLAEQRTCEVFKDDLWQVIPFRSIKKGDEFRLIEPTGELVVDKYDKSEFIATSNVYLKKGTYEVDIQNNI